MTRIFLFAKGNLDLHDSLHSSRVGGAVLWNGVNEVVRARFPAVVIRLQHETCTRADAVLAATGAPPDELARRDLPLCAYPLQSQFSDRLFQVEADAFVLSIQPEISTGLMRHREHGYLLYAAELERWPAEHRAWLARDFSRSEPLGVSAAMANLAAVIARIRTRTEAPILVYNMSPVVPGETVHCLAGLGETFSTRVRRFNLALADLSEATGISVVDVETVIARAGADALKLDALHLTAQGNRLVAEEVVRVLDELGVLEAREARRCA